MEEKGTASDSQYFQCIVIVTCWDDILAVQFHINNGSVPHIPENTALLLKNFVIVLDGEDWKM